MFALKAVFPNDRKLGVPTTTARFFFFLSTLTQNCFEVRFHMFSTNIKAVYEVTEKNMKCQNLTGLASDVLEYCGRVFSRLTFCVSILLFVCGGIHAKMFSRPSQPTT